jgi:hypothetical protein
MNTNGHELRKAVVVDTRVIDRITNHERGLMLNHLQLTNPRVGVILNFKHAKLEWSELCYEFVFIGVYSWLEIGPPARRSRV